MVSTISPGWNNWVSALAWSPDGKRLATAGPGPGNVTIWDPFSGENGKQMDRFPVESASEIYSLNWSRDGKLLAGANRSGDVWIWEAETANELQHIKEEGKVEGGTIAGLEWSPDNNQLVWYLDTKAHVHFWDIKAQKEVRRVHRWQERLHRWQARFLLVR
jgi:WD40 repeat protein